MDRLIFLLPLLLVLSPFPHAATGRPLAAGAGRGNAAAESKRYAVIFDAGSTGSRVHVYCFDDELELQRFGTDVEIFIKVTPGLSAYADDPQAAANSLAPLLEQAEEAVQEEQRPSTPVRLGATAGLRLLGTEKSEQILEAANVSSNDVRDLFRENSSLDYEADWVTVLSGYQEGYYFWVTVNYLLGNLGKKYSNTVGVMDLGGGSIQMAYAISEKAAANAPNVSSGEEAYVKELFFNGTKYYLYAHSYLNYGQLAARAEILKAGSKSYSFCILGGYNGVYNYNGEMFNASSPPSGASFTECRVEVIKSLKIDEPCSHPKCTFGGIWSGGGGAGQRNLYAASFFFYMLSDVGFVDPAATSAEVQLLDFKKAATAVCTATMENVESKYPNVRSDDLPYVCMDLVYQYTLLVDGFGLRPQENITLVRQAEYGDSGAFVEAAWPLGSAIEVITAGNTKFSLVY